MQTGSTSSTVRRGIVKLSIAAALAALPLVGVCVPADAATALSVPAVHGALPADQPSPAPAPPQPAAPTQYTYSYTAAGDDFCYACGDGGGGGGG